MIPVEEYERLVNRARKPKSLVQFFRESPLVGLDLRFERSRETGRRVQLSAAFCWLLTSFRNSFRRSPTSGLWRGQTRLARNSCT